MEIGLATLGLRWVVGFGLLTATPISSRAVVCTAARSVSGPLVMWDVEFRESPGWAFYLGNHAPEELGYRRAAYDRFAFLYNVRAVGSTAGVVFDNVRDSVVFGLFVEGSDGNCVTVMGNPGAELNLHMSGLVLRDCVRRPLSIGGDNDVTGLAVVGGVVGVVVEGLDVESGGLGVGAWGGLTLRGGRVVSRPPEGWNGNVFAWDVEVADVLFTAEVVGDEVGTVLVEDGGVQRRFAFRGVAVRGGGLVYKPRGGSLHVIRGGEFYGLRGIHANMESGGAVELDGVFLDVSDFAVSIGVERYRAYSVTAIALRASSALGFGAASAFFPARWRAAVWRCCSETWRAWQTRCCPALLSAGTWGFGRGFLQRVRAPLVGAVA